MVIWQVILLAFIEGLTEFIPVSSTGHLLLIGQFLCFSSPGKTFEVLIQLGAILALLFVYSSKIIDLSVNFSHDSVKRRFLLNILLAFLPAVIIGIFAHSYIKSILFHQPELICISLILGGIILFIVDWMKFTPVYKDVMNFTPWLSFKIGIFQCLAMVPGVSRSGATIVGALIMGSDKRSAAEFSFFLAMPTMVGAFTYDLYKNWNVLNSDAVFSISIGLIVSFFTALIVVRYLLDYVSRRGFKLFALWRIIFGIAGLIGLHVI
ncbi:MAG: Undecaprenyl-diphosphatase [Hyphomicrobiaceae bacterium hypho_1]